MAKVTRALLKDLVKECLLEVLEEGIGGTSNNLRAPAAPSPLINEVQRRQPRPAASRLQRGLDFVKTTNSTDINKSSGPTGNIMADILADTANNTLPKMLAAEKSRGGASMVERMERGDTATRAMVAADPMELFEGSSNWASLAFPDAKSK